MNKDILNYIKTLTNSEQKNLLEKHCKLSEESGELARAILPYMNSFGTNHRFVNKEDILEEIADCMLVLLSMLYDDKINLEFSELEDMISKKMNKWGEIQYREAGLKYPIPYEIHITVSAENLDVEAFKQACHEIKVKPIVLDLEIKNQAPMKDVMTSSVFLGNNGESIREVERISKALKERGFNVIREKIETVPWHSSAPSRQNNIFNMPENCYFECHFGILLNNELDRNTLQNVLVDIQSNSGYHIHLSRNFFKKNEDGSYKIMATYRKYDGLYEDFKSDINFIEAKLQQHFNVDKVIVEFSIYDTKVNHDSKWIGEK